MITRSIAHARWFAHANGVNPSTEMRHWLTDRNSLTAKLVSCSRRFRVQRLRQGRGMSLMDEFALVRLPRRIQVREREVVLQCDERPVVYAHTILPLTATAADWPFFNALAERSLGTILFGDPAVRRGALQFARLHPQHPLTERACEAIGVDRIIRPLYARRCLFQRNNGALLVTEVFLPAIADIGVSEKALPEAAVQENSSSPEELSCEMTS